MLVNSIFSLSNTVSALSKKEIIFAPTLNLSSANSFSMVNTKFLSFSKELRPFVLLLFIAP